MSRWRLRGRAHLLGCCALLGLLLSFATAAQAPAQPGPADTEAGAPRIGVVTMQPGEVFFERFGHDALVVSDGTGTNTISYNFGYFDPSEPDFIGNFVRGYMMYYLVALPLGDDLQQYQHSGRGASIQWLDLPPAQAQALATSLAERARPENARYRYDYFTANCATMVRDSLDQAMGGALHSQLAGRSRGNTWRSESVRLASPAPWMWLGFDLGLGPEADMPLSRWQEAFVPMRLAASLREVRNSEGRPLVQAEQEVLPHRIDPEPAESARRMWPWWLCGLLSAAALIAARHRPRLIAAAALPLWLLCGLGGALLAWLWGLSDHHAAWANRNLLLLSPLCLLLLPGAVQWLRGRTPGRWFHWLLWLVAVQAAAGLMLYWLSTQPQFNLQWTLLLLPIHVALAWSFTRPRLPAPPR